MDQIHKSYNAPVPYPRIQNRNVHDVLFKGHWLSPCSAFKLIRAQWRHMAAENWVNIGSGNGLLPDGTKPLPEPMLTYHQ